MGSDETRILVEKALDGIKVGWMGMVQIGNKELEDRLVTLAGDTALYWSLMSQGKAVEARDNLKFMLAEAKDVAAKYAIETGTQTNSTVVKVLETIAKVGAVLLSGLIAA
jgi:hypothetical protein